MTWRTLAAHGIVQRRVWEDPLGGLLHLLLVGSLAVLSVASLVAQVDGRLLVPRTPHRLAPPGWDAVPDAAGLVLLAAVAGLLARRLVRRPDHLPPSRQGTAILLALGMLALSGFALEGLAMSQQTSDHRPAAFVGAWVARWMGPAPGLVDGSADGQRLAAWRWLFWLHGALGMTLLAAVPFSRLRHALLAPLQQLRRAGDRPDGLTPPFLLAELVASGDFDPRFGLSSGRDLDALRVELRACASCGRCDAQCPVQAAGGDLSPRLLVDELAGALDTDRPLPTRTPVEALWSCLQCGACSEACPSMIQPHLLVAELRRGLLRAGRSSSGPDRVLERLGRSGNPFGEPRWRREDLPEALDVPTLDDAPEADWLYWVGCAGTWDPRVRRVVESTAGLLRQAGVSLAVLAEEECCTGDPARRSGDEARFQEMADGNLETLRARGVRRIVTHCPHCVHALRTEYAALGDGPEVLHHSELLARLLDGGRLSTSRLPTGPVALHDPCYLARFQGVTRAPRRLLDAVVELPDRGRRTRCCGGGGPAYWYEDERVAGAPEARVAQARQAGAHLIATACPYCLKMLEQAEEPLPVLDLAELLSAPQTGSPS